MRTGSYLSVVQEELWRPVVGSDDAFEVSNYGDVRKAITHKPVALTANDRGYLCCGVLHHGVRKIRKVHIMVAEAFIGPRPAGHEVAHRDGAKHNCRLSNLIYGTPKEHARDRLRYGMVAPSAKLTPDKVLEMRHKMKEGIKFAKIAAEYNVSYANVKSISRRRTWSHI